VSADAPLGPRATSAPELKAQIEAERLGRPFLVYRDADGEQQILTIGEEVSELWVGRSGSTDVRLDFDSEVSGLHAQIEIIGAECTLIDDGLSRNGSFVNGERVSGRRRLLDGDTLRFGRTGVLFRAPGQSAASETALSADALTAAGVSPARSASSSPSAGRSRRERRSRPRPPTARSPASSTSPSTRSRRICGHCSKSSGCRTCRRTRSGWRWSSAPCRAAWSASATSSR
jgi:pSer/pThr/pTyr-binding forkhead associated (FHA) protein